MDSQFPYLDQAATEVKIRALDAIKQKSAADYQADACAWPELAFSGGTLSVDSRQVANLLGDDVPPPRKGFKILPVKSGGHQRRFASNGGGRLRVATKSSFLPVVPGIDDAAYGLGVEFAVTQAMGEALKGPEAMQFLACLFMQIRSEVAALTEMLAECEGPGVLMLIVRTGPMAHHHDAFLHALLGMLEDHERVARMAEENGLPAPPPLLAALNKQPLAVTRHLGSPRSMPVIDDFRDMSPIVN